MPPEARADRQAPRGGARAAIRRGRDPADRCPAGDGAPRGPPRRGRAPGTREGARGPACQHAPRAFLPGRWAVQPQLDPPGAGDPLRAAEAPGAGAAKNRPGHRCVRAAGAFRPPRVPRPARRLPGIGETPQHVRREAPGLRAPADGTDPHLVQSDRHRHRAPLLVGPEPAEHPRPARGGGGHPKVIRGPARTGPPRGGLLANRTADPRAFLAGRGPDRGVRARGGPAPAHGVRPVRRPAGRGGRPDAHCRQAGELRDHLRDQPVRARPRPRDFPNRRQGPHRPFLRGLPQGWPVPGWTGRGGAADRARADPARAAAPAPRPGRPRPPRGRGTAERDQYPDPGLGGRPYEARHAQAPRGVAGRTPPGGDDDPSNPRRARVRGGRTGCRASGPGDAGNNGGGRRPHRPSQGGREDRPQLGGDLTGKAAGGSPVGDHGQIRMKLKDRRRDIGGDRAG
ncbi:MAG: hypothetical protein DDT40_00915 [candidate division WS2 bacterium]|nr:hypothetical protein [Candidatus Psychracetigena formicireducens]